MITTPRTALERHGWTHTGEGYTHGGILGKDGALYGATLNRRPGAKAWRCCIFALPDTAESVASTCSRCPERALTAAMVLAGLTTKETTP